MCLHALSSSLNFNSRGQSRLKPASKMKNDRDVLRLRTMEAMSNSNVGKEIGINAPIELNSIAQMESVSEKAGQRLYLQALETKRKIEDARKNNAAIIRPRLEMATRRHKSTKLQQTNAVPRYLQLYESSKGKKLDNERVEKTQLPRVVAPNEGCNRLYDLSKQMQQKGKERREEIVKSKVKVYFPLETRKIPIDQAVRMYDRGMRCLVSLEVKRIEAGMRRGVMYDSKLVYVKWTA